MYKGKKTCKILKEIRKQIAEKNDIAFVTSECRHQGDCAGTCPACEAEVRYLEQELRRRQQLGKVAVVAGLSVGLLAGLPGCNTPATPDAAPANTAQSRGNERPDTSASLRIVPKADSATPSSPQDEKTPWLDDFIAGDIDFIVGEICAPEVLDSVNAPTETSGNTSKDGEEFPDCTLPVVLPPYSVEYEFEHIERTVGDITSTSSQASFPGGAGALQDFLKKEAVYPASLRGKAPLGTVVVEFTIKADGQISNPHIVNSLHPELDHIALRAVKKMPRWVPAYSKEGKPIRSIYQLQVPFYEE